MEARGARVAAPHEEAGARAHILAQEDQEDGRWQRGRHSRHQQRREQVASQEDADDHHHDIAGEAILRDNRAQG